MRKESVIGAEETWRLTRQRSYETLPSLFVYLRFACLFKNRGGDFMYHCNHFVYHRSPHPHWPWIQPIRSQLDAHNRPNEPWHILVQILYKNSYQTADTACENCTKHTHAETETEREKEGGERESVCVCVCVYVCRKNSKFIATKPVGICSCQHTFKRRNPKCCYSEIKKRSEEDIYQSREWSWLWNTLCELRRAIEQKVKEGEWVLNLQGHTAAGTPPAAQNARSCWSDQKKKKEDLSLKQR